MPRSSSVSEKVWAQAIHAVTVQKMSLRRAAQLYGVHHMSLHRRVRGRYVGPATARFADEFQLAPNELDEAVSVLREQLEHEHHVTSDDVRYVVRTIACQGGRRDQQQHQAPAAASHMLSARLSVGDDVCNDTSESDSEHNQSKSDARTTSTARVSVSAPTAPTATTTEDDDEEKRSRQTTVVSAETWEKAMDAVEIHGMSLRNAAKAYGVHFAALHRRVKKRALTKETAPPLENYIPFEDEAGIVRVIHARADLGLLMSYDELVDLLQRTALKYAPALSSDFVRALVRRFQSRVEQSIRHLVRDWPLPRLDALCHFRSPTNSIGSDSGAMARDAAMTIASAADDAMASLFQPQRAVASLYARSHDFPSEPRPRLSVSAPFMRPLYARGADVALGASSSSNSNVNGQLASPSGALTQQRHQQQQHEQQLTSPRSSILRL